MLARPILSMLCSLLLVVAGTANAAPPVQTLGIKLQDPSTESSLAHMSIVLDRLNPPPVRAR